MAIGQGQAARAVVLQQQKIEIKQIQTRYHELYQRYHPSRDAAEMAALADHLGQWFEARAFKTLAVVVDHRRDDLRRELASPDKREPANHEPGRTLADLIGPELDSIAPR